MTLKQPIVLVGMMGAGKSAVGRALAERLHVPFRDSDEEIERAADATISEIFARDGEAFFRAREHEVIARLLGQGPCVLSTGGGAWLREDNRSMIDDVAVSLWLEADLPLLWSRVKGRDTRPLLRVENPRAKLEELLLQREPFYKMARLKVAAEPELSVGDMAQKVAALLAQTGVWEEGYA